MKKKIMAVCLTVCLAAVAVIGGTLAYFTDKDEAENVFTVGNVNIDLTEPNWDAEGSKDADTVYPGDLAAKNASMAIWLGKQYLGQRDIVELGLPTDNTQDDALSVSLREMAEGLESDG